MSTTPPTLSAGLAALANSGLLPANLTPQELQDAAPADLMKIAIGNAESAAVSSLFSGATASGDSVDLSANLTSTLLGYSTSASNNGISDPILQALDAALDGSRSVSTASTNAAQTEVGSLFSYLG
jgi:hypothetical protein